MMRKFAITPLVLVLSTLLLTATAQAQYQLQRHEDGVRVLHGDQLVADYLTLSKSKPILWPLNGPGGTAMTRQYPMVADSKNEKHDHPHHRSFWFTHGDVNGTDFWLEGGEGGITDHQKFTILKADKDSAVVAARNIWKTAAGKPVLTEERSYTFSHDKDATILDCQFVVHASHGDVNFGDTKEGTFGVRIAGSMKVDAKLGGKLVNSDGATNSDAWGKAAPWVDYVGPIGDKKMGIAILCHPSTFNYPNRWHVRTYGLFAANPFGVHHFLKQDKSTAGTTLAAGEKMTFRYRVILHLGDTADADIAGRNAEYAEIAF